MENRVVRHSVLPSTHGHARNRAAFIAKRCQGLNRSRPNFPRPNFARLSTASASTAVVGLAMKPILRQKAGQGRP
jgi:hypothetical protein